MPRLACCREQLQIDEFQLVSVTSVLVQTRCAIRVIKESRLRIRLTISAFFEDVENTFNVYNYMEIFEGISKGVSGGTSIIQTN